MDFGNCLLKLNKNAGVILKLTKYSVYLNESK